MALVTATTQNIVRTISKTGWYGMNSSLTPKRTSKEAAKIWTKNLNPGPNENKSSQRPIKAKTVPPANRARSLGESEGGARMITPSKTIKNVK
jgi:hypothetical protein